MPRLTAFSHVPRLIQPSFTLTNTLLDIVETWPGILGINLPASISRVHTACIKLGLLPDDSTRVVPPTGGASNSASSGDTTGGANSPTSSGDLPRKIIPSSPRPLPVYSPLAVNVLSTLIRAVPR